MMRPNMMSFNLEKKESEKQISVDPISLTNMHNTCTSLPSSPRLDSFLAKQKRKCKVSSPSALYTRQHSVALSNLERLKLESNMRRSKSCGEGRACQPSLDFDLWPTTTTTTNQSDYRYQQQQQQQQRQINEGEPDKFKCGACLFLPGFGKGKAVRARKEEVAVEVVERDIVSQRMSLERFECGSWRSSDGDTAAMSNLFFDLPVELMRCSSVNDTESPVTTGFVFDNNKDYHHSNRKGVLKTTSIGGGKPHESFNSSRHVRFSTSSPTLCPASPTSPCITPRLRRARDDFSAFLEAQSA
ncbi:hypothetical protein PHJA_002225500 [Phtheirospermum japonicum]|uniref:Uncharacterized protein n=1 Tax=Phtheirospermum japonicum TaxID=374723 RepID=A0A830D0P6_9LAMI|nr:hypothetical protein PHJA_002225500 [Phtheirospermum japonicum]